MFTLFVILVFGWLFFKSVGLAFHLTWGLAKIVATLLFVVALPLLVVLAVLGALLPLLVPVALVAAAYGILKNYACPDKKVTARHRNDAGRLLFAWLLPWGKALSFTAAYSPARGSFLSGTDSPVPDCPACSAAPTRLPQTARPA